MKATRQTSVLAIMVLIAIVSATVSAAPARTAKIKADDQGERISKYVYGQFIEHLGRCIYGGIWAEMLKDRKFYHPVGAKKSPWKAVGPAGAVRVVSDESYVGEHTPRVKLSDDGPRGIAEGGLALEKNRKYEGRVVIKGDSSARVSVSLVWGSGDEGRETVQIDQPGTSYAKDTFTVTAGADTKKGRLELTGTGQGAFYVGAVSLMPANNVDGMRKDTLELIKELDSPCYRWPGGNFVSGYNWRDGIGDPDRRPPRRNLAWGGLESNDFGLDEFMDFCQHVDAEPMIAVNSGFGDAHSAAEEVQYVNGAADTPVGRWRAANGHPEPYDVEYWCIGNEMFGEWQLGYMKLDQYVIKHNLFARSMRAVDPDITLIAVGEAGDWSRGMMKNCADHMDLISEHFYRGEKDNVVEHVAQLAKAVRQKVDAHRKYRRELDVLKGKDIDIALDEWNYWYGPEPYGQVGPRYYLKDALGVAKGLHEMFRNSDIFWGANYAQTVNVLGAIKTTATEAGFSATGMPLKLYRHHFGSIPVAVQGDIAPLDVAAAWTGDKKAMTVAVVNPTDQKQQLKLNVTGASLNSEGRAWRITGPKAEAYNNPGEKPKVDIEQITTPEDPTNVTLAPLSITLYRLKVQ